ncbi:MAG: tRNA (N(6)-L-threonylcarbamoyladenosine(37)-C(2))-methylthiotransferase MtaB [Wujia sp.]
MLVNINGRRVAIYTLGCKVNQYESDCMADILIEEGCEMVSFDDVADIYIINTCSVTNMAERKSRQIIHRAKKKNPSAVIVACGCYVQAAKEQLEADYNIDVVVGNNRKKEIARILDEYLGDKLIEDNVIDLKNKTEYERMTMVKPQEHSRAYVKVQDGCDNFCTYCIIPYTRGRIRSRKKEDVLQEVAGLAAKGIKEVVITGINLPSYNDEKCTLKELILSVADVDGIERVRMGSLEPRVITDDFLSAISCSPKICAHFHLSLQSACNDTLKRMNRKYTIEEYTEKCELIRSYYDRPAITTDVIVGFPGETEEEFEITRGNLERLNLYEMHIFKYSRRAGTIAADMPNQVPEDIKEYRSNILLDMTARKKKAFEDSFKGQQVKVLFEEYENRGDVCIIKGHTDRYILVSRQADEDYCRTHVNEMDVVCL